MYPKAHFFKKTPDRCRDENGVEMMADEAVECWTAQQAVVNSQDVVNRTAEPTNF